ncbi:MAG: phosphatase PAP2 family protein [Lachnospiraceae bacterium]|nr:phosphatase PAP2 family protein [Lachnospiraceae bacterium]
MEIELRILDWIQTWHTPVLDGLMCAITTLGNAGAIWILLGLLLFLNTKTRKTGAVVMAALVLDVLFCNVLLKPYIARVRPCDVNTAVSLLIARPKDFSFPSGHTAASFAAVAALWFAGEKKLVKPAFVLACLIAFSRLYLYVHYPTDILGGIVVGMVAGYLGYRIVQKGIAYYTEKQDRSGWHIERG